METRLTPITIAAAALVAAAGAFVLFRNRSGQGLAYDAGAAVASVAVDAVNGLVAATTYTAGDAIGIQRTSLTRCEQDRAAGRTWDASFSCPAGDFIKYLWN